MNQIPGKNPTIAVIAGGVAGLATAVSLRDQAQEAGVDLEVTVFEKAATVGGNLRTIRRDGWQLEWGPNGFLDNEPATLRLVERLGLQNQLQCSSDAARRRFLLVNGRLQEIPASPMAFLRSRMLSVGAKLRIAGELLVPARKDLGRAAEDPATDETVAAFGNRRLGRSFTDIMLDPMVKGIFGGEARRLSLAAAFPRMVELEKDYGGLFKAMIRLTRKRKKKIDAGPAGKLHSFKRGMAALVDALANVLAADPMASVMTSADVQSIRRCEGHWEVRAGDQPFGPFSVVVEAAPAHAAARHLGELHPGLGEGLAQIPFAPIAVIALGFSRNAVAHDLDGFGMLVPGREGRELLGSLWTSSIFPGRAPEDQILIRNMVGGAANPRVMELDDDAMTQLVMAELRPLLGLRGSPSMVRVIRHERAIAQYVPGHLARLKEIDRSAGTFPGLFLTGSSYRGISVNACIKEAESIARDILIQLTDLPRRATTEAKP